jgi:LacI family transcriptional regulator
MKKTTIKDIAIQLGVSPSTVSRALKDHPDIGAAMIKDVKSLAASLNYRPNNAALQLRHRTSRTMGLIIPEISMFFYPSVIRGIEDVLHEKGYSLLVLQSNDSLDREIENIQICYDNDVAGLLIALSHNTFSLEHLEIFNEVDVPVVTFDKVIANSESNKVLIDDYKVAKDAAKHLLKIGCKRLAGIFGNRNLSITQARVNGFTSGIIESEAYFQQDAIKYANSTKEAMEIVKKLMASYKPDAIFAMSDEIMAGVIPSLIEEGIKIPEDCSVLAISDGYLPHYMTPKVTHIHHDGYEMGFKAAERIVTLIQKQNTPILEKKELYIETKLVELQSTTKKDSKY